MDSDALVAALRSALDEEERIVRAGVGSGEVTYFREPIQVGAHRKILDALEEQQRRADENSDRFVKAMRAPAVNADDLASIKTHGWELAGRLHALRHVVDLLAEVYGISDSTKEKTG